MRWCVEIRRLLLSCGNDRCREKERRVHTSIHTGMSLRVTRKPEPEPPQTTYAAALFAGLFDRALSIGGTSKRKANGELANTRLGQEVSTHWLNERFRQTFLLIAEFRTDWNMGNMLSHDDVQYLRICLDVALSQAAKQGHVGDRYDMNPTVWSICKAPRMCLPSPCTHVQCHRHVFLSHHRAGPTPARSPRGRLDRGESTRRAALERGEHVHVPADHARTRRSAHRP